MGLNDEYSRDVHDYELAYDSDQSDEFESQIDPEDWQDMYSEELLDAWMKIRNYMDDNYIKTKAGYPEFVDLVLYPMKWYSTREPTLVHRTLWNYIKNMPIVCDRLQIENFFGWSENYIDYL
jgi:hypothetical protein